MDIIKFLIWQWRWLVEIAVLTFAFYGIYRLIRGTRSAAMLAGLALVLVTTWFLVTWLELQVLGFILAVILGSLPVMLVVLLQQEIRSGLAGLSLQNLISRNRSKAEVIEAIVRSCESLSEKKLGALIAIEHNISNQAVIETGVQIDAAVSEELLESIFYPKTPLHDGGVWIHDSKIVAAGCIFPVTDRESLHRSLGMRHRAAIGLTEECDAVVVVVSEESGMISLCYKGEVERPLNPDQLRQRLTEILINRKKDSI